MSGQSGAVLAAGTIVPLIVGYFLGGVFSGALEGADAVGAARAIFLLGAALMGGVALFGAFGPAGLFTAREKAAPTPVLREIGALLRCGAAWPPVVLLFLWNFAPAWGIVLQYHMANALHATDAQVGAFYAIYFAGFLPTFLGYGWLCQRASLRTLLLAGTIVGIPSMLPLLFIHTAAGALVAAVPIGMASGLGTVAYFDLAIRSCPTRLRGTMMMFAIVTTNFVAGRFGDLFGSALYGSNGGFATAVIASTIVYALILPALLLVPRAISAASDGEFVEAPALPG